MADETHRRSGTRREQGGYEVLRTGWRHRLRIAPFTLAVFALEQVRR